MAESIRVDNTSRPWWETPQATRTITSEYRGDNVTTETGEIKGNENYSDTFFDVTTGTGLFDDLPFNYDYLKGLNTGVDTGGAPTEDVGTVAAKDTSASQDVVKDTGVDLSGAVSDIRGIGAEAGEDVSFGAGDFDTDYSQFVDTITKAGQGTTDLTGIAGISFDVGDITNQLNTLSTERVDPNLVGGVAIDYSDAVSRINQAGRGADVRALMETGVSLKDSIDQILNSATDVSVDGLRAVDTGIEEIDELRRLGLAGVTEADIENIRKFREENRFSQNMEEALNQLRDYSLGQSEVDRKIAQGQLAEFDAASAANMMAERQKLFNDPTLSDSARRAALGVLNRNVSLSRAKIQTDLAREAAAKSYDASQKYGQMASQAAQFNEQQFMNDINTASNIWSKKLDSIAAAGGLREAEVRADLTRESAITDILGRNTDRALNAAVSAGNLSAEEKQLLLNKNISLANFDQQKIRNIMDSAVAAGEMTRAQATDTLTQMGMVADIQADNIARNINASIAAGEMTLAEGRELLNQQVTIADMSQKDRQIALESAVQAGLMSSREANDTLAILSTIENAETQRLALQLNAAVQAGALEGDEARMILDRNVAYANLVDAGAARDLQADIANQDATLREFSIKTDQWQTEVQARTNEVAYQLQQAVELGNMSYKDAALKWDRVSKVVDTNVRVAQLKLDQQLALADNDMEAERINLMKTELNETLLANSSGRLRAFMESVPGAYGMDMEEWSKNPAFMTLAGNYYDNVMGFEGASSSNPQAFGSFMLGYLDTMASPTELTLGSLREQSWYKNLDDEGKIAAEEAFGALDQIGTFGGRFEPVDGNFENGFQIVGPSGETLMKTDRSGNIVDIRPVELKEGETTTTTSETRTIGETITTPEGRTATVAPRGLGSSGIQTIVMKESIPYIPGDTDAFGENADKIYWDGPEKNENYFTVLADRLQQNPGVYTPDMDDYVTTRGYFKDGKDDKLYKSLIESPFVKDTVGKKTERSNKFIYPGAHNMTAGQFVKMTVPGTYRSPGTDGQTLLKFEGQSSPDNKSTRYIFKDMTNGRTYWLTAGPRGWHNTWETRPAITGGIAIYDQEK